MAEIFYAFVIVLCVGVLLRFTYMLGKDAAETEAYETISSLRAQLRDMRLRNQRLAEHMRQRNHGRFSDQTEVDLWMQ